MLFVVTPSCPICHGWVSLIPRSGPGLGVFFCFVLALNHLSTPERGYFEVGGWATLGGEGVYEGTEARECKEVFWELQRWVMERACENQPMGRWGGGFVVNHECLRIPLFLFPSTIPTPPATLTPSILLQLTPLRGIDGTFHLYQ